MNNDHVHPVFQGILNSLDTPATGAEKIHTNRGEMTINEVVDHLKYSSYHANRGYGMTHEQLVSIGIGNDAFREKYENENRPQ
jgi:hypothetical protein